MLCYSNTLMSNIKHLHNVATPSCVMSLMITGKAKSKKGHGNWAASMFLCMWQCVCVWPCCVLLSAWLQAPFCSLLWVGHSRTRSSSVSDLSCSAQTHIWFISAWSNTDSTHTSAALSSPQCVTQKERAQPMGTAAPALLINCKSLHSPFHPWLPSTPVLPSTAFKGIDHSQMKMCSFTHPHVISTTVQSDHVCQPPKHTHRQIKISGGDSFRWISHSGGIFWICSPKRFILELLLHVKLLPSRWRQASGMSEWLNPYFSFTLLN